jgi:hypothetical protein
MVVNKQQLAAATAKFFPRLGKTRERNIRDYAAYQRGRKDGHGVSLTPGLTGAHAASRRIG